MKRICQILSVLLCVAFLLCSCGNVEHELDIGLEHFVTGRSEQSPTSPPVDTMLGDLLEKYGGGFRLPRIIEIDTPEPTSAGGSSTEDEPTTGKTSQDQYQFDDTLESREDLVKTIRELCRNLDSDTHTFLLKNGYRINYDEIQYGCLTIALNLEPVWSQYVDSIRYSISTGKDPVTLQLNYSDTEANMRRYIEKSFAMAKDAEEKLGLRNLSDYEKCVAVNKYLCDHCEYSKDINPTIVHTTYGALQNGDCVCDGYARTFWLMLTDVGMDVLFITGNAGGPHAWNLVKVNGKWYQMDVCWNDGSHSADYFLVDDAYMKNSRIWDYDFYPACNSGSYR